MSVQLAQLFVIVYGIAMLAITGNDPNYELFEFASSISLEDIYANGCTIMDLNSDGMPEVYLTASNGWQYHVFYYLDGDVHDVEDMTPWAWSNRLLYTSDGKLVMYTHPHTTGVGTYSYRIWQWGEDGYSLEKDVWFMPTEWGWNGQGDENDPYNRGPIEFDYILSDTVIDPFKDEMPYDDLRIVQESVTWDEFEQKTAWINEAEVILNPYGAPEYQWDFDWWREFEREDMYDEAFAAIGAEIAWELLNWK